MTKWSLRGVRIRSLTVAALIGRLAPVVRDGIDIDLDRIDEELVDEDRILFGPADSVAGREGGL